MINRCSYFKKQISRYVDNDLDMSDRENVENHVEACLKCRKVLDNYMAIRKLVTQSYAAVPALNHHFAQYRVHTAHVLHFPMWTPAMKLAASIVLAVSIFTGISFYSFSRHNQSLPLVLEQECQPLMNTPLCALAYYEKISGRTIQSQFTNIQSNTVSSYVNSTSGTNCGIHYESPLFNDKSFVKQKYEAIISDAFAQ